MNHEGLLALLQEKQEREAFDNEILSTIAKGYDKCDLTEGQASAYAGNLFVFVANEMNIPCNPTLQRHIRLLLIRKRIAKNCYSGGYRWFIGLIAKDPSADQELAATVKQMQSDFHKEWWKKEKQKRHQSKTDGVSDL